MSIIYDSILVTSVLPFATSQCLSSCSLLVFTYCRLFVVFAYVLVACGCVIVLSSFLFKIVTLFIYTNRADELALSSLNMAAGWRDGEAS